MSSFSWLTALLISIVAGLTRRLYRLCASLSGTRSLSRMLVILSDFSITIMSRSTAQKVSVKTAW